MAKRVETLEQKIAHLQAQLQQAKAVEREKDRKRRNRQNIIGFTTLQSCLNNGLEIHLTSPQDLQVFLEQHVKGSSNRKAWGFDEEATNRANDNHPASGKTVSGKAPSSKQSHQETAIASAQAGLHHSKKPENRSNTLAEGPSQEELKEEFGL